MESANSQISGHQLCRLQFTWFHMWDNLSDLIKPTIYKIISVQNIFLVADTKCVAGWSAFCLYIIFVLQVSLDKSDRKDRDLQEDLWFELSSEALCNWMMFVRPAQNHLEQNLVAYQYGHHIYYTTIKNVEPKQELKVCHHLHCIASLLQSDRRWIDFYRTCQPCRRSHYNFIALCWKWDGSSLVRGCG